MEMLKMLMLIYTHYKERRLLKTTFGISVSFTCLLKDKLLLYVGKRW